MRPGTTVRPCRLTTLDPGPGLDALSTETKRPSRIATDLTTRLSSSIVWIRPLTKVSSGASSPPPPVAATCCAACAEPAGSAAARPAAAQAAQQVAATGGGGEDAPELT